MGAPHYPPELVDQVCELYQAGHGMQEAAQLTGVRSPSTVQGMLHRRGVEIRPPGVYSPITQARFPQGTQLNRGGMPGAEHPAWKGDQIGYSAAHDRVRKARGRPQKCSRCETTNPALKYEWANLTGNYIDVNDYERMCTACHAKFDSARRTAA
jgi:hypothetical protein